MIKEAKKKEGPSLDEQELPEAPRDIEEEASPVGTGKAPAIDEPSLDKAPMGSKARATRDKLAAEPKVRVFIPLASGEKQGVTQSVILNGYPMYIRKGTYVEVPQPVADVLEIKLKHKMSIDNHPSRISGEGDMKMTSYGS